MSRRGENTVRSLVRRRMPDWVTSDFMRGDRTVEQIVNTVADAVFGGARIEDAWRSQEPFKKNPRKRG